MGACTHANSCSFRLLAILVFSFTPAAAQDTVTIAGGSMEGRTKISGRILDYTGRELQLELATGRRRSVPAQQVLKIETQYGGRQIDADVLFDQGRFDQALPLYRRALKDEPRRWVRRQIIARMVWCYRALGQPDRAGEAFLLLIDSDPDTPHFDCIPLAWMPGQPSVAMEQAARQWLLRDEPVAALLGASQLLSSRDRPAALKRLRELTTASDRRIATLAMAQTWRAAVATANDRQIDAWTRAIDKLPEPLAAGPYFVLGRAMMHRQRWEQAALAMLHVPILYPQHRALAAAALLAAGRSLQKFDRPQEAVRLYRELIQTCPETRAAAEAQNLLKGMTKHE